MSSFKGFILILSISGIRAIGKRKEVSLKDQLARSLNHVGEILTNIEDKIDQEREILSQIEYDLNHHTSAVMDYETTAFWWDLSNQTTALTTTPRVIDTTVPMFSRHTSTISTYPTPPEYWHLPTLATESPFIQDIKKTMTLDDHGYFTAFLTRFSELVYTKDPDEAYAVLQQVHLVIKKHLASGTFNDLDDSLITGLKQIIGWFHLLTPGYINRQAGVLHFTLKDKRNALTQEVNTAFDFYDDLFTEEEGEELFASLEPFYDYPNVSISEAEMSQRMVAASLAPYLKIRGKKEHQRFVELIFMSLETIVPEFRSLDSENKTNIHKGDNQSTLPVRRNINNNKNKLFLKKLSLSERPKFSKNIKRQYEGDSRKNSYYRSPPNLKYNYRNRVGGDQRYLHEHEQTRLSLERSDAPDEEIERDTSENNAHIYDKNKPRTNNKNRGPKLKRHNLHNGIKETENRHKDKSLQYSKQFVSLLRKKQQSQNFKRFKAQSSEESYSQYFQNSIENDLLHKIREVSSYSDEEDQLRNNLYDALRHGNRTFVSFRKSGTDVNNKQTLRDLSSETDEEWVFKNNIYKVFEQK